MTKVAAADSLLKMDEKPMNPPYFNKLDNKHPDNQVGNWQGMKQSTWKHK